jgi:dethiobiotin synthetase
MPKILIAGNGTDVGKTIVAAILTTLYKGDYWKPIQCGTPSDTSIIKKLISPSLHIHPSAYSFSHPLSPHHASRLEGITIVPNTLIPPHTTRPLIIEGVGGLFVPITPHLLTFDIFQKWQAEWIIVSKNELGSINTTLLTLYALKKASIHPLGIIFNGEPNLDSEEAIVTISNTPFLERLLPEKTINPETIRQYAKKWNNPHFLKKISPISGTPSLRQK